MTDINWIAVADRLHSDGGSIERVDPVASRVLSFLSYAIRDGVDAAERFELEKAATRAADKHAEDACEARDVLPRGWREEFVSQFIAAATSPVSRPHRGSAE